MIEKFTFDIQLKKQRKKIILVKQASENREHVVLKLLSYIIFYDPELQIEVDAGLHYKPDLVILNNENKPTLWIDCGQVSLAKLESLTRKLRETRIILVKQKRNEINSSRKLLEKKVNHPERVEYLAFEKGFIPSISVALNKKNEITCYEAAENVLGVALNEQVFESDLYR